MSLSSLITNFITSVSTPEADVQDIHLDSKKGKGKKIIKDIAKVKPKTITELKTDPCVKNLSKYVRGGLSKLSKQGMLDLIDCLKDYEKDRFIVGGREVKPDEEQIQIIDAPPNCNIRVIAGAGTGKTTTIGCRIKRLLDRYTTPDKILVLTFNVEARKNLESMIDRLMGFEIKMEIRTIDSFCYKLKCDFYGGFNTDMINTQNENPVPHSLSELGIVGRKIMEKYGPEISAQYKYVFFDEFQDVNEDQFQILKSFANNGCYLTVIGDDSQNIYQFRGSDNYYIINFDRIIPNVRTYKITTNYRSTKEIVELANNSISNNKDKIHKLMRSNTVESGKIDLTVLETRDEAIDEVMLKIKYYTEEMGLPYDQIAILSRNTFTLKQIETEFEREKIPYVALISDDYSSEFKQLIQENRIVVSTVHKAKGLEWKVVFIVGLADAHFPSHLNNGLKNIEEERRLFYVAATRAKKYLHFVTDAKSVPLSRFLREIENHVDIVLKSRKIKEKHLFVTDDVCTIKDSYSVTKIIEMMSGRKIEQLRKKKLIPDMKIDMSQLFTESLFFTDDIKKNVFESDFGIYCDYYLTRKLMVINKQKIRDVHAERILLNLHMTDEEKLIYKKYDLKNCLIKGKIPINVAKNDVKILKELVEKLKCSMQATGLDAHSIEQLIAMGVDSYHYPRSFLTKLRESYTRFKDPVNKTEDIDNAVYYVSLCPKFNNERRRLVYREIKELYDENANTVFPRIDDYVEMMKEYDILCKLHMHKQYKIEKDTVELIGELDYINISTDTLVDIKCSEGEFKIEWMIQLLIYYSLFRCNPSCTPRYNSIELNNIAIFNVFTGKFYNMEIPENYPWEELLDFIKDMIADDLKGIREKHEEHRFWDENVDMSTLINRSHEYENDEISEDHIETLEFTPNKDATGYIVLDLENNCMNNDIIQLAYIVYTDDNQEVKRVNRYVKDRFADSRSTQLTKITTDMLKKQGVNFRDILIEFVTDLQDVKSICGHHLHTDIAKIRANMVRYKFRTEKDLFEHLQIQDTSTLYRQLNGKGRSITLTDMYKELFGKNIIDAHDALSDVEHTAKCIVELKRLLAEQRKNGADQAEKIVVAKKVNRTLFSKHTDISNLSSVVDHVKHGIINDPDILIAADCILESLHEDEFITYPDGTIVYGRLKRGKTGGQFLVKPKTVVQNKNKADTEKPLKKIAKKDINENRDSLTAGFDTLLNSSFF